MEDSNIDTKTEIHKQRMRIYWRNKRANMTSEERKLQREYDLKLYHQRRSKMTEEKKEIERGKDRIWRRKWRDKNRIKVREYARVWGKENREHLNNLAYRSDIKWRYGLNPDDYDKMFSEQRGLCYICGNPERNRKHLSVDHNHNTGIIRKLLCDVCNRTLGMVNESPELLEKMASYLREFSPRER